MNINFLNQMILNGETIKNYVTAGLTSTLLGERNKKDGSCVRLFSAERETSDITPHSHRFDFQCYVICGQVINKIYYRPHSSETGDLFQESVLKGKLGEYTKEYIEKGQHIYKCSEDIYEAGSWYGMNRAQIHSIVFKKDTKVIFFEGPNITDNSVILEPIIDGEVIPTFKVEPWMFKKVK